jgi:hypothetical protein
MDEPPILVVDDDTHEVVARLDGRRATVDLVDILARAQLAARRSGRRITIRNVGEDLRGLLELVGLAGVLAVEPRRQPELGEQLRIEEVMEPGDRPV